MKASLLIIAALVSAQQASAHRLDEYLQGATISLSDNRIDLEMRLTPGVAVLPLVLATMDRDADGHISTGEEAAYVDRLLSDLSLTLDGKTLALHPVSKAFPSLQEMQEGRGEIRLAFFADAPRARDAHRQLHFENRHQPAIGVYLVNTLVPNNPAIEITAQNRDYDQSSYDLNYRQGEPSWWSMERASLMGLALLLTTRITFLRRRRRRRD